MLSSASEAGTPMPFLQDAVEHVARLGESVRALIALTVPSNPIPSTCTIEEIVLNAKRGLGDTTRTQLAVARVDFRARIHVDGPLLTAALRRLVENALEAGSENVLVVARRNGSETRFAVLDDGVGFDPDWGLIPFRSTKKDHLGLGLPLVRRDVETMGGRLEFHQAPRDNRTVLVIPDHEPGGGPAVKKSEEDERTRRVAA